MTHDAVLVFSKTWGAVYLLAVFVAAAVWTYWPSRRRMYDDAAQSPLDGREDQPWQ
ncbi:cbb3-type cytochrome c oxidase subunit 3 [Leisingera thetidis]|uniref:cbb3-type cytochrome c oxidase subunit 3 n=1 Tax=Leisingera thetidis TaxID=2930199 RepID=UPI0021F7C7A4|nr:cbb3-type cytochrome c oxidase subunit 3 [Leisingera thetidis]